MIDIEIKQNLSELHKETLISLIGNLLTAVLDESWAYDVDTEMVNRISDVLKDHDIEHTIVQEEDV